MSLLLCGSQELRRRIWPMREISKIEESKVVTSSRMWPGERAVERK